MLQADPSPIDARGGDGCTPLHFARDLATAEFLVSRGANIDARDEDHDSTPPQWGIGNAPEVSRYLLEQGAAPDIFLAAALGDFDLAARLVSENPLCVAYRIGRLPDFPPNGNNGFDDAGMLPGNGLGLLTMAKDAAHEQAGLRIEGRSGVGRN